jgi:hypothetical protein
VADELESHLTPHLTPHRRQAEASRNRVPTPTRSTFTAAGSSSVGRHNPSSRPPRCLYHTQRLSVRTSVTRAPTMKSLAMRIRRMRRTEIESNGELSDGEDSDDAEDENDDCVLCNTEILPNKPTMICQAMRSCGGKLHRQRHVVWRIELLDSGRLLPCFCWYVIFLCHHDSTHHIVL